LPCGFERRLDEALARRLPLDGELDDEDRVFRGEVDGREQPRAVALPPPGIPEWPDRGDRKRYLRACIELFTRGILPR